MKDNYRSSIYSICKVRRECGLPCRDCMYYGKDCDEYKRHLQKLAERDNEIYMLTHYTKKGRRKNEGI